MSHTCPEGMIMRACQHPMMVLAKSLWNITCLNHLVVLDAKIEMRSSETFNPVYTISKKFCLSSFQSLASPIPSALIANMASASGKHGESYILHILVSPLHFLRYNLQRIRNNIYKEEYILITSKPTGNPSELTSKFSFDDNVPVVDFTGSFL